jgi:predicted AlkP superfamily pyrophosphatase or phosphodiesterase
MRPLILINAVGLSPRLLQHAPRLNRLASEGSLHCLSNVVPAVTCTAQATMLTGQLPNKHGIVGNGWLFRDTGEVRFWQQSNRLMQAEPVYQTARRRAAERGISFKCAKLFWWFNQGAAVDISVTPKPYYGADGNKAFGIYGTPEGLTERLEKNLGPFPFHTFWGPKAGLPCTQWIARCAAEVLQQERPDLTLVYLPHLDYDPQRFGPKGSDMPQLVSELDQACVPLLEAAQTFGARTWVVSEYGHVQVNHPILINQALRRAGLLAARRGPFGETLDTFESQAFAVCDHQVAHIYIKGSADRQKVRDVLLGLAGVQKVYMGDERDEINLSHERAGELVVLSEPDSWLAYPFWIDDRHAPDYARTVDIHRKPGYDPCELFVDPRLWLPGVRIGSRLLQKKLGFRTLFDVVPLDATLVRGSHGLPSRDKQDGPLWVFDVQGHADRSLSMTILRDAVLQALDLPE